MGTPQTPVTPFGCRFENRPADLARVETQSNHGSRWLAPCHPSATVLVVAKHTPSSLEALLRNVLSTILFAVTIALGGCFDSDISGVYVQGTADSAAFIQIVQRSDGHVEGRFDFVSLKPDGTIDRKNGALDGAYRSGNVVLSLHIIPIIEIASFSGTADGHALRLSAASQNRPTTSILVRSNESEFERMAGNLISLSETRRAEAKRAMSERKALADAARLAGDIRDLSSRERALLVGQDKSGAWVKSMEARYEAITNRIAIRLRNQRGIQGEGQATAARAQVFVAITQDVNETQRIHLVAEGKIQQFASAVDPLERGSDSAHEKCSYSAASAEVVAACAELRVIDPEFRSRISGEEQNCAELEDVYKAEITKQRTLEQQAQLSVNGVH